MFTLFIGIAEVGDPAVFEFWANGWLTGAGCGGTFFTGKLDGCSGGCFAVTIAAGCTVTSCTGRAAAGLHK